MRLTANPRVFPKSRGEKSPGFWPQQLREYTDFRGLSFPYICIALIDDKVVGRLYLDPNSNNAINRDLNAAIIDNVVVDPDHEEKGVADKLIEFAENIARQNGVRWLEIGVVKDTSTTEAAHKRKGTDSARSFIRRGFYKHPFYLKKALQIHYQARDLPNTFILTRYKNGLVMYKDLETTSVLSEQMQGKIFGKLVGGMPQ